MLPGHRIISNNKQESNTANLEKALQYYYSKLSQPFVKPDTNLRAAPVINSKKNTASYNQFNVNAMQQQQQSLNRR
jgi:hypothetical protein